MNILIKLKMKILIKNKHFEAINRHLKCTKDLRMAESLVVSCFTKYKTRPVLKFS